MASERVVVVTGAAGGIGSSICQRFTSLGDTVLGLDLAGQADAGTGALGTVDVTDAASCERAVAAVLAAHGRIDVLCNNAGIAAVGDVVAATPDDWQRVFAVNVFGVANMARAVVPHMRARRGGVIVNTCSIAATVGLVERAVYSASKGAVLALTKAMAADEVPHGIRVNCVSPATASSPWVERLVAAADDPEALRERLRRRQPLGRMVTCDEVADAVVYLAAPTTFATGIDLLLDGGISGVRRVE